MPDFGRRLLVIMVKEPVAGRVKTRLGHDIGVVGAANVYRQILASVTARLARDRRWTTVLSVAPAAALGSHALPVGIPRLPQAAGDLGQRMQAIFDLKFRGPLIVIGTDIPHVRPAHIWAAFRALGRSDMVFGPATDGGFWLVGMRRTPRVIDAFPKVRWSTAETLQDCRDGLQAYRLSTAATLRDIDDVNDLEALGPAIGRWILPR